MKKLLAQSLMIDSLDRKNLDIIFQIPINLNDAIEISKNNNPDLIIAKLDYEQF